MNDTEKDNSEMKLSPLRDAADNLALLISDMTRRLRDDVDGNDITVGKLKDLTSTVKTLVAVIRDINGLPTESEREELELMRKKYELSERRYAGIENDAIHIVIDGDGEELAG